MPRSANTARDWIIQDFEQGKKAVIKDLAQAKSRVTISFDGWKADNEVLDLLDVVAHYIDYDYKVKTVTPALRDIYVTHSEHNTSTLLDGRIAGWSNFVMLPFYYQKRPADAPRQGYTIKAAIGDANKVIGSLMTIR